MVPAIGIARKRFCANSKRCSSRERGEAAAMFYPFYMGHGLIASIAFLCWATAWLNILNEMLMCLSSDSHSLKTSNSAERLQVPLKKIKSR
jgi:hypothetical protein